MPRIKRWFPVNHNINRDPEVWAMRRQIGEKSLSIWLEFLSIADQHDGLVPGQYDLLVRSVSGTCQSTVRLVSLVYQYAINQVWLKSEPTLHVVKYWNYHKHEEPKKELFPLPPDLPDLSDPNQTSKKKNKIARYDPKPWPKDDLWLSELLKTQIFTSHCANQVQDYEWWEFTATSLAGIDRPFIEKEFAKISAWWRENPTKRKTAKGMRRFLRTWLDKAKNDQGRLYAVKR